LVLILGAIAFVAQRLLPSLQSIYSSWAKLKIYSADINKVELVIRKRYGN